MFQVRLQKRSQSQLQVPFLGQETHVGADRSRSGVTCRRSCGVSFVISCQPNTSDDPCFLQTRYVIALFCGLRSCAGVGVPVCRRASGCQDCSLWCGDELQCVRWVLQGRMLTRIPSRCRCAGLKMEARSGVLSKCERVAASLGCSDESHVQLEDAILQPTVLLGPQSITTRTPLSLQLHTITLHPPNNAT